MLPNATRRKAAKQIITKMDKQGAHSFGERNCVNTQKSLMSNKNKKKTMIIIIFLLLHYSHPHFLSVLSILLSSLPSSVEHTCWLEHTNARQTGNYYLTTGHGKEKEVSVCLCVRERVRLCHLSYITHVCFNGFPL